LRVNNLIHLISSKWPRSGQLITILSLVIFPILVILTDYLYTFILKETLLKNAYFIGASIELTLLEYSIKFVQITIFIMILIIYPPYPAPITIKDYFRERGYRSAVIEYEYVKIILYIAVPLFILLTALPYFNGIISKYIPITFTEIYNNTTYKIAQTVLLFVVLAGILKMILAVFRKKFRLYFARGCFLISTDKQDETEKIYYLIKGLESYNSYLKRNFNLQLNNIKDIVSKIIGSPIKKRHQIIYEISKIFTNNRSETNELEMLRSLKNYLNTDKIEINDIELDLAELIVKQPTINKVRDIVGFFAVTAIPLAISVADLISRFLR
jgi:hypothetical protein